MIERGILLLTLATMVAPLSGQSPPEATSALRRGEYEQAIELYGRAVRLDPADASSRIGLMEALVSTGEYEEAVEIGRAAPADGPVANALGQALLRLGHLPEAEAAFTLGAREGGPWALTAEVNLAELMFDRGEIEAAMARFDRFIDIYNGSRSRLRAPDIVAVARAVRYLGRNDPGLFQDALRALDEAASLDPGWDEPRVRAGMLFLEKYSSPEAKTEFEAVLEENPKHPGALLGMAKALEFDGTSDSRRVLGRLLETDPNNVEGRVTLALQSLTREAYADAQEEIRQALAVNPRSLTALTAQAAAAWMTEDADGFARARVQVLELNPRYAGMDTKLADLAVQTRRYAAAVERAGVAVGLDSAAWEAWGLLGMNQMRLGRVEEGRVSLERAFAGDPYNPWFKNSLDLLDTFDRYAIHETEHFQLFLNDTEGDLLATYLAPLAEEAYDSLSRRYGVEPALPVRAELYPSHADFSVRTLGEAGLGALGVSFGNVLVMDSPTARELGDYNWASVFWHELSHTFHLAMTDNRVPRWFSEGLAVHEQRKAREGWGHQPTIGFLRALQDGKLKKVSELNDGFMRPDYPEQVIFSYYEASLVFQLIEDRWSFDAVRRMLQGYRRGETTAALVGSVLGLSEEDLDETFDEYLGARFREPLRGLQTIGEPPGADVPIAEHEDFVRAHPGDLVARLRLGALLMRAERYDDAEEHFQAALRIFPDYGAPDSPYWFLAEIHRQRGELAQAAAALARLNALSESNYAALLAEAEVLEELGRGEESARVLDKAVQVWPYDLELHGRLAELHTSVGDFEGAVRERQAIVALAPVDRAEAYYRLALAQRRAGDAVGARRSVLRALDVAPNYEDALELLLELRAGASGGPR